MHANQLADLLKSQSLFSDCDADELSDIILRGHYQRYAKGQKLMTQGDTGSTLYVILSGIARVSMVASNGREIVLDYSEAGSVLGEIALLDGGDRTATVEAIQTVEALSLTRDAFRDIVARHQGLAFRLLRAMARRLRQSNDIIETDRAFTAGPRLARYLLRLMVLDTEEGRLKLSLSQGELGNFAGMSREQINRQLSGWADSGIVELKGGQVLIKDKPMLLEMAEGF